ncbi:MAG: excinuclease ABC subunit UvrA [Candidatus Glassbacteria bacterium]|nr:excinuclease ABC subunit UvrA [Candidatus Glassbacteria bacterium]
MESITIKGARQHNLKNIDLELPRKSLVVVSGLSGSGKSSLVFDTLYQESRRRFFETLPTYVLQFMERVPRPDFDSIEGLSPAVAVEQRNPVQTSRSTVGTLTEIYDYLRLVYARAAETVCPGCGRPVAPDNPENLSSRLLESFPERRVSIAFAPPYSEKVPAATVRDSLLALGFLRVIADPGATALRLDESGSLEKLEQGGKFYVVLDRLTPESDQRTRLAESLREAFLRGEGALRVYPDNGEPLDFSGRFLCASCDRSFPEPSPNLFSFNSPYGACPTCRGFGNLLDYDPALIVPDAGLSLEGGALDPWTKPRYEGRRALLGEFCRREGIDMRAPWSGLAPEHREMLLVGAPGFEGVLPFLQSLERKKYKQYIRFFLRSYQSERVCPDCSGSRLRPETENVLLVGLSIGRLSAMDVESLGRWLDSLPGRLSPRQSAAAADCLREIVSRLDYLREVGLGYLTLDRMTRTLSGGEYQRIMLTRLLGSGLTDTLFVLDEPTIGLHQRDTRRLIRVMRKLVEAGNSLVVVEHDREVIGAGDYLVELGPGSGEQGGQVVFSGTAREFAAADTPTADWLAERSPPKPHKARKPETFLRVVGAKFRNLKNVEVEIPLKCFSVVSGVSGSGKSSLVAGVIRPGLEDAISHRPDNRAIPARCERIDGCRSLGGVVMIDQSPIGRTPRSNPATYIKAFDEVRRLFAGTAAARRLGLGAGHFSFNTAGGRCEHCKGAGFERIEMHFMADIFVPCEACQGRRFKSSALKIRYRGLSVDEVLGMTVNQAIEFFGEHSKIGKPLWLLQSVGLGYLKLGQSATTLSGGESQRLKIARQLAETGRTRRQGRLYLLDEPTTGLHALEVRRLLRVLDRLVESGNTLLVVEHHPEVIAHADWIIDLGPEGGEAGGEVVVQGPPEKVAACRAGHTGKLLRE